MKRKGPRWAQAKAAAWLRTLTPGEDLMEELGSGRACLASHKGACWSQKNLHLSSAQYHLPGTELYTALRLQRAEERRG